MRTEKFYICPVCETRHESQDKAIRCRNKHPIKEIESCYCETCGEGWSKTYLGTVAVEEAKNCENKHQLAGDEAEVATRTYFLSGGRFGRTKVLKEADRDDGSRARGLP